MTSAARAPLQRKPAPTGAEVRGVLQRCGPVPCDCPDREDRGPVLRRHAVEQQADRPGVPPIVHEVLRSPGSPLPSDVRTLCESRFGRDFSGVRIHTDAMAAASAAAVSANAYTVGNAIVFGSRKYAPTTTAGSRLLQHELTHVLQQRAPAIPRSGPLVIGAADTPSEREAAAHETAIDTGPSRPAPRSLQRQPSQSDLRDICEPPGHASPPSTDGCTYQEPGRCVTYGQWIATFGGLRHFTSRDTVPGGTPTGQEVIGAAPASAAPEDRQPPPVREQPADRFIDHPTDQWVQTCLPENLRQTAYQLPADCADIAVILRHVWLAAHHRTETWGRWVVGDLTGGAGQSRVGRVIGEVFSGNVQRMVNAYSDPQGHPLTRLSELQDLLHPGDVLVWEHHQGDAAGRRTGGHTQTIVEVRRDAGRVVMLRLLQGNQPITEVQAGEIQEQLRAEHPRGRIPSASELRAAPGRRIEVDILAGEDLRDLPVPQRRGARSAPRLVWTWADGSTTLIAAGPPAAAPRPAAAGRPGHRRERQISDWFASLRAASQETLDGTFEAALLEARSTLEAGSSQPSDPSATQLGQVAGERLWRLARQSQDLGDESHFGHLQRLRAVISAIGGLDSPAAPGSQAAADVRRAFTLIAEAFELAARGATSIEFPARAARGSTLVRLLITGFDPFNPSQPGQPPPPGAWNPSGAAVLALDGTRVTSGDVVVAVEGVVLPVDFTPFDRGLVERIVRPLSGSVDAVITVSMDPSIEPGDPVRLERFAVGVHRLDGGQLRDIPGSGGATGPAIIETGAPLEELSSATAAPSRHGKAAIPAPSIGDQVAFEFATQREADDALIALGLPAQQDRQVEISDLGALRQIGGTAVRGPGEAVIRFQAGGRTHRARLISGPGGSFLSNEVSYRVLRLLSELPAEHRPLSFHVHTQRGDEIPQAGGSAADQVKRRGVLERARNVRTTLVATLTRLIQAVGVRIAGVRHAESQPESKPGHRRRGVSK